jgi:hypothetical protein
MAPNNLLKFFHECYQAAITKYETPLHDEALQQLTDLLMDPQLPMLYRLKTNLALADGNTERDWHLSEGFRKEAESVYSEIRARCPVGDTRWPAQEHELVNLRKSLDTLAEEQLANQPQDVTDQKLPDCPRWQKRLSSSTLAFGYSTAAVPCAIAVLCYHRPILTDMISSSVMLLSSPSRCSSDGSYLTEGLPKKRRRNVFLRMVVTLYELLSFLYNHFV